MKALTSLIMKIIGIAAAIYGVLFAVFYFDLDGKLLYYVWEPLMIRRFDNMKKGDATATPYGPKENVES